MSARSIARELSVSAAAVSLALNDSGRVSLSFSLLAVVYALGGTAALTGAKVFFARDHALAQPGAA